MSRAGIERKLSEISTRLRRAREELAILDEQLAFFADAADDARVRALVAEIPVAEREHHEAQKHADAMARSRAAAAQSVAQLEREQDELLDRLAEAR